MRPWYQCSDPHVIFKDYKIMKYLRVVPPEEMKKREEDKEAKDEKSRIHREKIRLARKGLK